jgi:OTU domain-containing protein 3
MAFANYPWSTVPTLHISYHLGEHYNSVRLLEDPCTGPPLPIGHELTIKNENFGNAATQEHPKVYEEEKEVLKSAAPK